MHQITPENLKSKLLLTRCDDPYNLAYFCERNLSTYGPMPARLGGCMLKFARAMRQSNRI